MIRTALKNYGMKTPSLFAAAAVGVGSFYLFQPGDAGDTLAVSADISSITSAVMELSIKDMIVDIVPSNFLKPFLESNMLQLIFLAVICGIAAGRIGKYSDMVKDFFEAFNDLFLKVTTMIIGFMPIAVFCSILSVMGMFRCMSNCLGDVAVSTVVAKKEGVLDMETYTSGSNRTIVGVGLAVFVAASLPAANAHRRRQ